MARPGRCALLGVGLTAVGIVAFVPPVVLAGVVALGIALASVVGRWHPIRYSRRRLSQLAARLESAERLRLRGAFGCVYSWAGRGVLRREHGSTLRFVPSTEGLWGAVVTFDGAQRLHRATQVTLGTLADTATEAGELLLRWLDEQADVQLRAELTADGWGPVVLTDGVNQLVAHGRLL
jgi:hypothetical protein